MTHAQEKTINRSRPNTGPDVAIGQELKNNHDKYVSEYSGRAE